jgi:hypothetical protein
MEAIEFKAVLTRRLEKIVETLDKKSRQYGNEDRFSDIKRAGEIQHISAPRALCGMWMKHVVSVLDIADGQLDNTEETVDEKIGDAINYLILLEGVLKEMREVKRSTPQEAFKEVFSPNVPYECHKCAYAHTLPLEEPCASCHTGDSYFALSQRRCLNCAYALVTSTREPCASCVNCDNMPHFTPDNDTLDNTGLRLK